MPQEVKLNEEQQAIFDKIIKDKSNIFFTGCAGTGKTFLLKKLISELQSTSKSNKLIAVTASTGRAAFSISGTTLHSFAGIGLGKQTAQELVNRIRFNKKVSSRWKSVSVLIIDEISMITGTLFDKLEFIARKIRNNEAPFGGIQLILTGDLLQLPPVDDGTESTTRIFESESWKSCIKELIALHTVMRQSDLDFVKVLTCIRVGAVTDEVLEFVKKVSQEKIYDSESGPVNLFATKSRTDHYNTTQLDKLDTEIITYMADDQYVDRNNSTINLLNNCPVPSELNIKVGAQVMLVKNLTTELVNGTVGVVTGLIDTNKLSETDKKRYSKLESTPIVRFTLSNGKVQTRFLTRETWETQLPGGQIQASRTQIPLILAWAVTIHKSQGQTIQRVKADLTSVFEYGQIYTALSRAISIDTLEVVGFEPNKIKVDQKSLEFYLENDLI